MGVLVAAAARINFRLALTSGWWYPGQILFIIPSNRLTFFGVILLLFSSRQQRMNIFWLYWDDPEANAQAYCDRHVVKIILEITQLLFTAWHVREGGVSADIEQSVSKVYRKTHANHPLSVWVRENRQHYIIAAVQGLALCNEYTKRYEKEHACEHMIRVLLDHPFSENKEMDKGFRCPPQCVTFDKYRIPSINPENDPSALVTAYRNYYREEKATQPWFKYSKIPERRPFFLLQ